MKKSPLSTPSDQRNNFYQDRGRKRGYGYNHMRNDNVFPQFSEINHPSNSQFEGDMIPLDTSSPIHSNRRRNYQPIIDRRTQRFSNTGISGSYSNQRIDFQKNSRGQYSPHKFQRNYQQHNNFYRKKNEAGWHRNLPISEFLDMKKVFEDPWVELQNKLGIPEVSKTVSANENSVMIILEKNNRQDSSVDSLTDEGTINISSSCDEVKEGSSLDLPLENINFTNDSKSTSILSSSCTSQSEKSFSESKISDDSSIETVDSSVQIKK